jgi:tRNA pseudouridine38-40 synthase
MATWKVTLEYEGTAYGGWQRQPDTPTIQAAVEHALHELTQREIGVVGAGRTDAGVHALGQVASFRSDRTMEPQEWTRGLNALLPADISVRSTERVPDDFHARYSARGKVYEYRILNRRERSALHCHRAWHVSARLDLEAMRSAGRLVVGPHDFRSFQGPNSHTDNPVCDLRRFEVREEDHIILIQAEADRFLKQMIRALVGTVVEIGQGKRSSRAMKEILQSADRRAAGYTAPAHGLYLVRVDY